MKMELKMDIRPEIIKPFENLWWTLFDNIFKFFKNYTESLTKLKGPDQTELEKNTQQNVQAIMA